MTTPVPLTTRFRLELAAHHELVRTRSLMDTFGEGLSFNASRQVSGTKICQDRANGRQQDRADIPRAAP